MINKACLLMIPALCLAFLTTRAQGTNYMVKGKAGSLNAPAKAYLIYSGKGSYSADSSSIKNGVFAFNGKLDEPLMATLVLDRKGAGLTSIMAGSQADFAVIYLENVPVTVNTSDSVRSAVITGGTLNETNKKFHLLQIPIEKAIRDLTLSARSASQQQQADPAFQAGMEEKYAGILAANRILISKFCTDNPASLVSLDQLVNASASLPDPSEAEGAFNVLSEKLRNSPKGAEFAGLLARAKVTAIGSVAPDFSQADTSGKQVKLSSFRGKYVLVDFWASWCHPCRMENPNVVMAYEKYKQKNFTVLGVSLDKAEGKDQWLKAIKDDRLSWTEVSDLQFWSNQAAGLYGVRSIPQNFLLDKEGRIIAKNLRGEDLDLFLAKLLK